MGVQSGNSQRLLINSFTLEASIHPHQRNLDTVKLTDIIIQNNKLIHKVRGITNTLNEKIAHKTKTMNEFSTNTKCTEVVCIQSNTDVVSMKAESTQYQFSSCLLKVYRCIDINMASSMMNELTLLQKIQNRDIDE